MFLISTDFSLSVFIESYLHNSSGVNINSLLSAVGIVSTWIIITGNSVRYALNAPPLIATRVGYLQCIFYSWAHGIIIQKSYGQ